MADIKRTWGCQNCGRTFDAWEPNPGCPGCGCVRVSWVPAGGHVARSDGSGARTADRELRALADCFKMTDMRSASRDQAAKVVRPQPVVDQRNQQAIQFAPGFAAVAHPNQAVCVPSTQGVNFKARPTVGSALSPNGNFPSVRTGTVVEARHSGKAA